MHDRYPACPKPAQVCLGSSHWPKCEKLGILKHEVGSCSPVGGCALAQDGIFNRLISHLLMSTVATAGIPAQLRRNVFE